MATGIPRSSSKNDVAPLSVKRLADVPIVAIGAFRAIQEKEDRRTGDKYEVEQVKLSIDFDSGHIMRNADGDPVYNQAGDEQPFYINEGFVTLSGNEKAKLVEILKAIGFDTPEFIVQEGKDAGALTAAAADSLTVEFGVNGLGHDYSGETWDDLPLYVLARDGGKDSKRDVEVPVLSLKILGHEVIGRSCDLALTIKNGYNRVTAFLPPVDPQPLTKDKPKKAKGMPVEETADDVSPFTPTNTPATPPTLPNVTEKHSQYLLKVLLAAKVPVSFMAAVLWALTETTRDDFATIEDAPVEVARKVKKLLAEDEHVITAAYEFVAAGGLGEADDADVEEDEDF